MLYVIVGLVIKVPLTPSEAKISSKFVSLLNVFIYIYI